MPHAPPVVVALGEALPADVSQTLRERAGSKRTPGNVTPRSVTPRGVSREWTLSRAGTPRATPRGTPRGTPRRETSGSIRRTRTFSGNRPRVNVVPSTVHCDRELTCDQAEALQSRLKSRNRYGVELNSVDLDGHEDGHKAPSMLNAIASGIINFLLMFGLCGSYGLIMFNEHCDRQHRAMAVKLNLSSAMIMGMLLACLSRVPVAVGGPDLNPVVFLGAFTKTIGVEIARSLELQNHPSADGRRLEDGLLGRMLAPSVGVRSSEFCEGSHELENQAACREYHDQLRATVIFSTAVSSGILGLTFILLGRFRLSRYVSYVPTSVQEAFLSCIGYKVFMYALHFTNYELHQFVPAACVGVPLYFLKAHHVGNPALLMPLGLVLPVAIFYVVMYGTDQSLDQARDELNLFFPEMTNVNWTSIWTDSLGKFDKINIQAWLSTFPDLCIMTIVCVMDCMLKMAGTEAKLPVKLEKDHEFTLVGAGNLLLTACGSSVGYMQLKFNVLAYGILGNTTDRRGGILYALLCGICFFTTIELFNLLPRFFLSSTLFFAGAGFVCENLWGSRKYLNFSEWTEILIILGVFIVTGQLLHAVLVGIGLTSVSFIRHYSKIPAIAGKPLQGAEVATYEKHTGVDERHFRHISDSWLLVVRLKGFVFFASVKNVVKEVTQRFKDEEADNIPKYRRLKFVIFDCGMLDGMDVSAAKSLQRLVVQAAAQQVSVLFSSARADIVADLHTRGILPRIQDVFPQLEEAVSYVEEMIISHCKDLHAVWMKLHPAFSHHQAMLLSRAKFDPFGYVLTTDVSRFSCPWSYCSKVAIKRFRTVLWEPGQVHGVLYLVFSGAVGLFTDFPTDLCPADETKGELEMPVPVAVYRPGSFLNVGSIALAPNPYKAIALEDGELVAWDQEQWARMSRERPNMVSELLRAVMRQMVNETSMASAGSFIVAAATTRSSVDMVELESRRHEVRAPVTLPEEMETAIQELEAASVLSDLGLFAPVSVSETVLHPAMPPVLLKNLEDAFYVYASPTTSEEVYVIRLDRAVLAMNLAGVFCFQLVHLHDAPQVLTMDQFTELAHEVVMARLNADHLTFIRDLFWQGTDATVPESAGEDGDQERRLSRSDVLAIFQAMGGDCRRINAQHVDGIVSVLADNWYGDDSVDEDTFLAAMARFIRKHEYQWSVLRAMLDLVGDKHVHDKILTVDALTQALERIEYPADDKQTLAEEMLWASDWPRRGSGAGQTLDFRGLVSAVGLLRERPRGSLPKSPELRGSTSPRSPRSTLSRNRVSAGTVTSASAGTFNAARLVFDFRVGFHNQDAEIMVRHTTTQCSNTSIFAESSPEDWAVQTEAQGPMTFKQYLHLLLEEPNSFKLAAAFSVFMTVMILVSVLTLVVEPFIIRSEPLAVATEPIWFGVETYFTMIFTVEWLLRLWAVDAFGKSSKFDFLLTPSNVCDAFAVMPWYIEVAVGSGDKEMKLLRIVRMARLSRMARVGRLARKSALAAPVAMVLVVIWGIYMKHGLSKAS